MDQKNFYNNSEEYFEVLKNEPESYYREFIDFVEYYLKDKQARIIDLGCGTGQSSFYLARAGYKVTGFDFSRKFIEYAKKNFLEVNFVCGDVASMEFADGSFDALVTYNTVEHLVELEAGLKEMIRIVKPGGSLIIQCPNLLSPKLPLGALKHGGQTFEGRKNIFQLSAMATGNICRLAIKSIFRQGEVQRRMPDFNYDFPDNDAVIYINPIDLRTMLERNGCRIEVYQKTDHKEKAVNFWSKLAAWFFPGGMSIIRIVARKKTLKVAFVNTTQTGDLIYPLGALSIGSCLLANGLITREDYRILDVNISDVKSELFLFEPDLILFSTMTVSYMDCIKMAKEIKKKLPTAILVIGGIHISAAPWSFDRAFDLGVIGEGELTVVELLSYYKVKGNFDEIGLAGISGLIFWQDGEPVFTLPRSLIENLDSLPDIDWTLLPDDYLLDKPVIVNDKFYHEKTGHILTSRGCPFRCIFCSTSSYWQKFRLFSCRKAAIDIFWLYKNWGISIFCIWDDMFAVSKQRVSEFIEIFRELGVLGKLKFNIQARANIIDDEMCRLFKELGVYIVGFGFESGSRDMVAYLKGCGADLEKNRLAVELLEKHGIGIAGSFMLGNPGESRQDLDDTIGFMEHLATLKNVYRIWFGLTVPYPGTGLWRLAVEQGLIADDCDWSKLDILHTRYSDRVPEPFFKIKATSNEFATAWKRADAIVGKIIRNNQLRLPKAYADFEKYENENILRRFKNFSFKQKVMKVIYKPEKAWDVLLEIVFNKKMKKDKKP